MEKNITKKLEMLVSNLQNPIFVNEFRVKFYAFYEKVCDKTEIAVKRTTNIYRRTSKYVYGKGRIKRFLITNMDSFEKEHLSIVDMIERQKFEDRKQDYDKCKGRISAIIRANRRMSSLKGADKEKVKSYLGEYITRRRFEKKYELAT
jgi:hypothetical protein